IAVTAGAEHHNELAAGVRSQCLQRFSQRVRFMRVIDEDGCAVALGDPLQPAPGGFEKFKFGKYRLGLAPGADGEASRDKGILDLEFADQWQPNRMLASAMFHREFLRVAIDLGLEQTNPLACAEA